MTGPDAIVPIPKIEITPTVSAPRDAIGGVRHLYEFPNGYGASVIQGEYTYGGPQGLWEVAILDGGELCYTTPITEDVIGYCTDEDVAELLLKIAKLSRPTQGTHTEES